MDNYKVIFFTGKSCGKYSEINKKNGLTSNLTCVIGHMIIICLIYIALFPSSRTLYKSRNTIDSRFT